MTNDKLYALLTLAHGEYTVIEDHDGYSYMGELIEVAVDSLTLRDYVHIIDKTVTTRMSFDDVSEITIRRRNSGN